jgi:hypothetical protein
MALNVCENCQRKAVLFCLQCGNKCCLHCDTNDDVNCSCGHMIEQHIMDPDMMTDYESWVSGIPE